MLRFGGPGRVEGFRGLEPSVGALRYSDTEKCFQRLGACLILQTLSKPPSLTHGLDSRRLVPGDLRQAGAYLEPAGASTLRGPVWARRAETQLLGSKSRPCPALYQKISSPRWALPELFPGLGALKPDLLNSLSWSRERYSELKLSSSTWHRAPEKLTYVTL